MKQCDSCGMPLGEKSTSKHDENCCVYCQNQDTGEMASYEQVREGSVKAAVDMMSMSQEEAEKMADTLLPKLPRWQKEKGE